MLVIIVIMILNKRVMIDKRQWSAKARMCGGRGMVP